jgi:uncharacterized membrane protein YeaQ/YmgE (transglycosylase-associated protein family)
MHIFATVTLLAGGQNWLAWIVLGAIAGFVTKKLMGGDEGFITETILGIVGAVVFSFLASLIFNASFTFIPSLLVAIIGAVVVVAVWRSVSHATGRASRL